MASQEVLIENLARLRWASPNLTQAELAQFLGVSPSWVAKYSQSDIVRARSQELAQLSTMQALNSEAYKVEQEAWLKLRSRIFSKAIEFQEDVLDGKFDKASPQRYIRHKDAALNVIGTCAKLRSQGDAPSLNLSSQSQELNLNIILSQDEIDTLGQVMKHTLDISRKFKSLEDKSLDTKNDNLDEI